MKTYNGEAFSRALITLKIDGIRVHKSGTTALSRAGKPLYHVPADLPDGIYECFLGSLEATVTALRTVAGGDIQHEHFYRLDAGAIDPRLVVGEFINLSPEQIGELFKYWSYTHEGLVIRPSGATDIDDWYKVKAKETLDLVVLDVQPGTGRNTGRMGALITERGKVGTGFTDADRERKDWLGKTIEVECMGLTKSGAMRHSRFLRERFDK